MMLLDSNIIIYASLPEHADLRHFIAAHAPAVSAVSYVEVLGYHRLSREEETLFRAFFRSAVLLQIDQAVLDQAVLLRQQRSISLGDALMASTAIVHGLTLVTHNTANFHWIDGLDVYDPMP